MNLCFNWTNSCNNMLSFEKKTPCAMDVAIFDAVTMVTLTRLYSYFHSQRNQVSEQIVSALTYRKFKSCLVLSGNFMCL